MIGIENFSILTLCHLSRQHQFGISLENNLKKLFPKSHFPTGAALSGQLNGKNINKPK
jgi:hypothetical protein